MTRVTVFLMGGLGNQLFQIFTAMAYSLRNGYEFMFQDCKELPIGTMRPTYWENLLFTLKPFLVSKQSLSFPHYKEKSFSYNPLQTVETDVMLYGYFQSLKYFQEELAVILDILEIPAQISKMRERFPETSRQASMHFRITGYRELNRIYTVAPYEYYSWALSQIPDIPEILYFNQPEDTAEVEEIITRLSNAFPGIRFISAGKELQDWEQMLLMSCCSKHIIANSTFSWWGAMLNGTSEVYYPCNWFGPDAGHSISDLVLPSWHGYETV